MKDIIELFTEAENLVRQNGFGWEIERCDRRPSFYDINDQYFLSQFAWVVFNSGMSNRVINAKWSQLQEAFQYFIPFEIVSDKNHVRRDALKVFGNKRKVDAVITVAQKIVNVGFENMRRKIDHETLEYLEALPMIGKVTKYHLARNLGFEYVKPDRHLSRLALKYGMNPFNLCYLIHEKTGRRIGTIDVILWRYCEQQGQTRLDRGKTKEC